MASDGFFRNKNGYTVVQNSVTKDERLSLAAKGLYLTIQAYITMPDVQWKKSDFMRKCVEGEQAFERVWKELKIAGYLKTHLFPTGRGFRAEFELLDAPVPGAHTYYYNIKGDLTSTNETRNMEESTEKQTAPVDNPERLNGRKAAETKGKREVTTEKAVSGLPLPAKRGYGNHIPSYHGYAEHGYGEHGYGKHGYADGGNNKDLNNSSESDTQNNPLMINTPCMYSEDPVDNSQPITVTMEPGAERRLKEEREKWEKKCQEQKARQNNQPITIRDLTGITNPSRNGSVASEPKPVLNITDQEGDEVHLDFYMCTDDFNIKAEIQKNGGIPLQYAFDRSKMIPAILSLCNWNEHVQSRSLSASDRSSFALIAECLVEMATSREMFEVKGSYLSYSHFIGKINEIFKAFDCSETALEKIVLRTIAKYNQFRTKSKIKYPKSYLRVAVWETMYYYQQEIIDRENTPAEQQQKQSGMYAYPGYGYAKY